MRRYVGLGIAMLVGAAIGAATVGGLQAQTKPKAYTVTEQEVLDPAAVAAYLSPVQAAVKAAGAHLLNTTGKVVGIMGAAPPKRVIINEWDNLEQAQAFYNSKAFKDLAPLRDKGHEGKPRLCGGDREIGASRNSDSIRCNLTTRRKPQAALRLSIFPISRNAKIDAKIQSRGDCNSLS